MGVVNCWNDGREGIMGVVWVIVGVACSVEDVSLTLLGVWSSLVWAWLETRGRTDGIGLIPVSRVSLVPPIEFDITVNLSLVGLIESCFNNVVNNVV